MSSVSAMYAPNLSRCPVSTCVRVSLVSYSRTVSSHLRCHWGAATLEAATTLGNTLSAAGPMTLTGAMTLLQWHVWTFSSDWSLQGPSRLEPLYGSLSSECVLVLQTATTSKNNITNTFMAAATCVKRHSWDAQTLGMWEQLSEHNCYGECHPTACLWWHEENVCLVSQHMHFAHVSCPTQGGKMFHPAV